MDRPNITRTTHRYIREHPSVADCIERGLINYSALAREICASQGLESHDAVVVACRRYYERRRPRPKQEERILDLIKRAKIRLRTKIAVIIADKANSFERTLALQKSIKRDRGDFNLIEGEEVLTIITNDDYIAEVREALGARVRKVTRDVVQITMLFDQRIETTAGVVSYLYRLFSESGINIREEMSCWTDVMVVIDEADAARAMQVLAR